MTEIVLRNQTGAGDTLQAIYLADKGMNMVSFKKNELEIIDQSTKPLFDQRYAGLGALIGPHFHRRRPNIIAPIPTPERFPHIGHVQASDKNIDPFSHGISRYAPWKCESDGASLRATLKGNDLWNDVPLKELEGQDFTLNYSAKMQTTGLEIEYSVVSEYDSLVGLHYYYHLPNGKGKIMTRIKNKYLSNNLRHNIPSNWSYDFATQTLNYPLTEEADYTFYPFPDPTEGSILLETESYRLNVSFCSPSEECSWQLYHPQGASFVCIEPLSAQDPHHPNLTVSSLKVHLSIE